MQSSRSNDQHLELNPKIYGEPGQTGKCEAFVNFFFFFFLTNLVGSHALQLGEKKTIETLLTGQMCSARSVLVIFNFEHPHSRERKSPFL